MSHRPKYSTGCQTLMNAIVAAAQIPGASVVLNNDAAHKMAVHMKPSEFKLFDIQNTAKGIFTVTLRP